MFRALPPGIQLAGSRCAARYPEVDSRTVLAVKGSLRCGIERRTLDCCAPFCAYSCNGRLRREPAYGSFIVSLRRTQPRSEHTLGGIIMKIIGCDFHPAWEQVAALDQESGEVVELKMSHEDGEAERFYRALSKPALIGIEATGNCQWFLDMLQRFGHEVWL